MGIFDLDYAELYNRVPKPRCTAADLDREFNCEELRRLMVENGLKYTHPLNNHRQYTKQEMVTALMGAIEQGLIIEPDAVQYPAKRRKMRLGAFLHHTALLNEQQQVQREIQDALIAQQKWVPPPSSMCDSCSNSSRNGDFAPTSTGSSHRDKQLSSESSSNSINSTDSDRRTPTHSHHSNKHTTHLHTHTHTHHVSDSNSNSNSTPTSNSSPNSQDPSSSTAQPSTSTNGPNSSEDNGSGDNRSTHSQENSKNGGNSSNGDSQAPSTNGNGNGNTSDSSGSLSGSSVASSSGFGGTRYLCNKLVAEVNGIKSEVVEHRETLLDVNRMMALMQRRMENVEKMCTEISSKQSEIYKSMQYLLQKEENNSYSSQLSQMRGESTPSPQTHDITPISARPSINAMIGGPDYAPPNRMYPSYMDDRYNSPGSNYYNGRNMFDTPYPLGPVRSSSYMGQTFSQMMASSSFSEAVSTSRTSQGLMANQYGF
eukprot:TRINITY_DN14895_c0_g1::TRINITY_DN14895_c0_g1_i1::g.16223::m.16223 TRINITY_DN14895_c0_g1::TRINITY_DN14895_c0_g1_i1::g.16223  ORF type:complete len:484 (-),score=89.01,DUF305/PF03713.8/0.019 TRINITY_DN14895_c0_g1_i1:755-2206(-)